MKNAIINWKRSAAFRILAMAGRSSGRFAAGRQHDRHFQGTDQAGRVGGRFVSFAGRRCRDLQLSLTKDDALADDNKAWAAVNSSRRPKVLLVTAGNESLELALATPRAAEMAEVSKAKPDVLKSKEHQRAAAAGASIS